MKDINDSLIKLYNELKQTRDSWRKREGGEEKISMFKQIVCGFFAAAMFSLFNTVLIGGLFSLIIILESKSQNLYEWILFFNIMVFLSFFVYFSVEFGKVIEDEKESNISNW